MIGHACTENYLNVFSSKIKNFVSFKYVLSMQHQPVYKYLWISTKNRVYLKYNCNLQVKNIRITVLLSHLEQFQLLVICMAWREW